MKPRNAATRFQKWQMAAARLRLALANARPTLYALGAAGVPALGQLGGAADGGSPKELAVRHQSKTPPTCHAATGFGPHVGCKA
jgi:hypothetical protein